MRLLAMVIGVSATALAFAAVSRPQNAPVSSGVEVHKITGISNTPLPGTGKITGVSSR
jgi:hypothetical protein